VVSSSRVQRSAVVRPCDTAQRRLVLKLFQKDVAERIGVDVTSLHNLETNVSQPSLEYMPAIVRFLGYNPLPPAKFMGGRLVRQRTVESAKRLDVDPSTLAKWERGEREPAGAFLARVDRFLVQSSAFSTGRLPHPPNHVEFLGLAAHCGSRQPQNCVGGGLLAAQARTGWSQTRSL